MLPSDRIDQALRQRAEDAMRKFRDPHYQRDHPVVGKAGMQYIWRFPNGYGATADLLFTDRGLHLQPVEFTGVEITSFVPLGECHRHQSEEEIEQRLEVIEGLVRELVEDEQRHVVGLSIEANH